MSQEKLRQGVGELTAAAIRDAFGAAIPGIEGILDADEHFKKLKGGHLDSARKIAKTLKSHIVEGAEALKQNPFFGKLTDVTKSLVGSPIICIYSPGSVEAGLITVAAGYSGEGDPANFTLPRAEPGTIGVWGSTMRGGYKVACISAHPIGEEGYVALWGVTIGTTKLGMNDIAQKFGFDQLEGQHIMGPKSQIKIGLRNPEARSIAPDLNVYASTKKGKGCVCAYELKLATKE